MCHMLYFFMDMYIKIPLGTYVVTILIINILYDIILNIYYTIHVVTMFITALASISIPKTIQEALSHPGWRQVIFDEMSALESNHT